MENERDQNDVEAAVPKSIKDGSSKLGFPIGILWRPCESRTPAPSPRRWVRIIGEGTPTPHPPPHVLKGRGYGSGTWEVRLYPIVWVAKGARDGN